MKHDDTRPVIPTRIYGALAFVVVCLLISIGIAIALLYQDTPSTEPERPNELYTVHDAMDNSPSALDSTLRICIGE